MTISRRAILSSLSATLLLACASAPVPSSHPTPSRLELRAASDSLILDGDVLAVREVRDPERDGIAVSVELSAQLRQRIEAFTSRHVGERVAILIGGRPVLRLTIRDPVTAPTLLLTAKTDANVREMERELGPRP
ncbi:MAG: hypothetical protein ACLQVI_22825 [Polyangiaceae bacterium]